MQQRATHLREPVYSMRFLHGRFVFRLLFWLFEQAHELGIEESVQLGRGLSMGTRPADAGAYSAGITHFVKFRSIKFVRIE